MDAAAVLGLNKKGKFMDARHVIQIVYTWFSFTLVQNRVCSMGLWYMTHTPKNQEMSYDNKGGKTKQESPTKFLILNKAQVKKPCA